MKTFSKVAKLPEKALLLAALGVAPMMAGCPAHGLNVKVYYLSNEDAGLVRRQEQEIVPFPQAEGYRCMSPQDFDAIVELVRSCVDTRSTP